MVLLDKYSNTVFLNKLQRLNKDIMYFINNYTKEKPYYILFTLQNAIA